MGNFLFVGGTTDCPLKGIHATEQSLVVGNTLVSLNSRGLAVLSTPLRERMFDLGNGIYLEPWDIIKGVLFGVLTKFGVEKMFKAKSKKKGEAFRNGFVVGGLIGGLETTLDTSEDMVEGTTTDPSGLTHELFQGILVQGGIAGLTNVLLTWATKKR